MARTLRHPIPLGVNLVLYYSVQRVFWEASCIVIRDVALDGGADDLRARQLAGDLTTLVQTDGHHIDAAGGEEFQLLTLIKAKLLTQMERVQYAACRSTHVELPW